MGMKNINLLLFLFIASSLVTCTPLENNSEVVHKTSEVLRNSISFHDDISSDDQVSLYPIILVPALAASTIEAKLNKTKTPHPWICYKKTDWYTLWISPSEFLPLLIDCFKDNFIRVFNNKTGRTENPPGVQTRVPGWGSTSRIEYVGNSSLGSYFVTLVNALVDEMGYERDVSIRGAPYDFRLAPYENEEYFDNLKALVEETYSMNGNKRVIFIAHSMGCTYTLYFLKLRSQEWKDKYIRTFITIGAPFGGAVKALAAISSGEAISYILSKAKLKEVERSASSTSFLLPVAHAFGERPIMSVMKSGKQVNLTAKDFPEIFNLLNDTNGYRMWQQSKDLISDFSYPGVDVKCIVGTGLPTVEYLMYPDEYSFPMDPLIFEGDGDGTVNTVSATACLKWAQGARLMNKSFSYQEFQGTQHRNMVKHKEIVRFIVNEIKIMNYDLERNLLH